MQNGGTDLDTFYCGSRQYPDAVIGRIIPAGSRGKKRLTLTGTGYVRAPRTSLQNVWGKYTDDIIHVAIGEGLTELECDLFAGLRNLRSVYFPRTLTAIYSGAFSECGKLEVSYLPDALQYIGPGAFQGCFSLEQVTFGSSLKNIQAGAFRGCKSLNKLAFPSTVTEIGNHAFADTGIERIVLPDSLEALPTGCFSHCEMLQEVTAGKRLSVVSDRAFSGCTALEKLDFRSAKVLYHIHELAFLDCNKVKAVFCREDQVALLRRHFKPELLIVL